MILVFCFHLFWKIPARRRTLMFVPTGNGSSMRWRTSKNHFIDIAEETQMGEHMLLPRSKALCLKSTLYNVQSLK